MHKGRQAEAKNKRPQNFPEHGERHPERMAESINKIHIPATQRRGYKRCTFMTPLAALCRFRGFHGFGVFAEAGFAVAKGAVMERPLCVGHVRGLTFPRFEDRRL